MTKLGLLSASALGSAAFIGLTFAAASPAYAQSGQPTDCSTLPTQAERDACTAGTPPTTAAPEASEQAITVTGSRIRRPNLSSPVPITSVTAEELPNQGQASIGDALNDLPALRSTFSQQNSGRFIGTAGNNFLDLRGLGTARTLVLVNSRRHVTSSAGDFIVDVNTIPQDLIERIDVVTGGEAAVYGSDAVAGVVNFILKRNFDGIRLRAQDGVSTYGDRPVEFVSLTAGRNFADGRGNIAINLEYTHADQLLARQRSRFDNPCGFEPTGNPAAAGGNIPDNTVVCGIRLAGLTAGGGIGVFNIDGTSLSFDRTGNLVLAKPAQSFLANGGDIAGTDPLTGVTLNETGALAVGQNRYTANVLAHFDVSEALKPFIEAKYVRQKVFSEQQATFFQGPLSSFFGIPDFSCGNPFLNAQAQNALTNISSQCARRVAVDTNGDGVPDALAIATDANGRRIFDPTRTFAFNGGRYNVDFGGREEIDTRTTYRIVGGIEGDFNNNWHYEVSANYGHYKADNAQTRDLLLFDAAGNPAGFSLAVDAVRNAAGQIVCRVNQTTVTVPGCVPLNLFGEGAPSQAAVDFSTTTSHLFSKASELDIIAYVSGDTGKWFKLPGGAVGFSIGAEYRRETAEQHADPISAAGGTFFNAFKPFNPPAFDVKEIYGELNLPILKDMAFARELSVSGAARYSDYNTSAGNTWAWNVSGIYAPVSDLRLRANYSKSVRVPTLSDLYSPANVNFEFIDDPCNQVNINNGTASRAANCAALGVPTTFAANSPCIGVNGAQPGDPFINCNAEGRNVQITSAGNPNLKAETGKSLTVGGVFTPRFLPGFSLSVDYFDIKVTNLISVLSGQQILTSCVDAPTINNQFCPLLNPRNQFGLFPVPALLSAGVNFAKQTSRGVDFDLGYRHTFGNGHVLNLRGIATYTMERNNYTDPTDPTLYGRQLSNLGDPVFSGSLLAGYQAGPFSFDYTLRYIGTMTIFPYEDTHTVQGRPPQDPDVSAPIRYPQVFYHDARVQAKVNNRFRFYLGVDNIFNKLPPLGLTGTGAGGAVYSNIGRFFYSGVQVDF
jgi:outer membrane receptor protein involved in Fe transport